MNNSYDNLKPFQCGRSLGWFHKSKDRTCSRDLWKIQFQLVCTEFLSQFIEVCLITISVFSYLSIVSGSHFWLSNEIFQSANSFTTLSCIKTMILWLQFFLNKIGDMLLFISVINNFFLSLSSMRCNKWFILGVLFIVRSTEMIMNDSHAALRKSVQCVIHSSVENLQNP